MENVDLKNENPTFGNVLLVAAFMLFYTIAVFTKVVGQRLAYTIQKKVLKKQCKNTNKKH